MSGEEEKPALMDSLIGSFQAATKLARRYEQIKAMRPSHLRGELIALGLPACSSASEQQLLERLHLIALWDTLPPDELQAECESRGISYANGPRSADDKERCAFLKNRLWLSLASDALSQRGVPANRLRSLEEALKLDELFGYYRTLEEQQLRRECADRSLPITAQAGTQELYPLLRDAALWDMLSTQELRLECQRRCVLFDWPRLT